MVQKPTPGELGVSKFGCVALSDVYLAIGTSDRLLVFLLSGDYRGQWVLSFKMHKTTLQKLQVSPDGTQFLAYTRAEANEKVLIYSASSFPTIPRSCEIHELVPQPSEVEWEDLIHKARGVAFSRSGRMIGICTSHSRSLAAIRLLKRDKNNWNLWGVEEVKVFPTWDLRECIGLGLTGISL